MSEAKFFVGIAKDGVVNTVSVVTANTLRESFDAGEIIVPCTVEQARALWGQKVDPLNLNAALQAVGS